MNRWPSLEDSAQAPVWENYVVAQAAQAALRLVPVNAAWLGVRVDAWRITLTGCIPDATPQDLDDLADIAEELSALLGQNARVATSLVDELTLHPNTGVRYFFAARPAE